GAASSASPAGAACAGWPARPSPTPAAPARSACLGTVQVAAASPCACGSPAASSVPSASSAAAGARRRAAPGCLPSATPTSLSVRQAMVQKAGFVPRIVNGRLTKPINQFYNKHQAELQSRLGHPSTTAQMERVTTHRTRQIDHYLHTASRRLIDLL